MKTNPAPPITLLRKLGHHYRHVGQEHVRQPLRGATRRRLADDLQAIEDQFERLLVEWVSDHDLRTTWREFLHGRAAAPEGPSFAVPPLFKGRTDAGARIEIRPASEGYDILVDGARIDHGSVPWHLDPDMRGPTQIGSHACEETFDVPEPATRALADFLAGGPPPWRWARELVEDGLIDGELALTPRGQRCLARARAVVREVRPRGRNVCVLVADAARARVLLLDTERTGVDPETSQLVEVAAITNPTLRARDSEVLADSGSGRRGGARTPLHSPPDHRDHHRREVERQFAVRIAEEAAGVWRRYPSCELILAASPVMLGLLRPAIQGLLRAKDQVLIRELARDLTKLSGPMLHDLLAGSGLVPERGRRPPIVRTPGLPI